MVDSKFGSSINLVFDWFISFPIESCFHYYKASCFELLFSHYNVIYFFFSGERSVCVGWSVNAGRCVQGPSRSVDVSILNFNFNEYLSLFEEPCIIICMHRTSRIGYIKYATPPALDYHVRRRLMSITTIITYNCF